MTDKMDMALDDIIKTNKPSGGRRGGGRGAGRGGRGSSDGGGPRRGGRGASGGSGRSSFNGAGRSGMTTGRWNHDMYQGQGSGRSMPPPLMSVSTGPVKLTISNLDYGVTDSDIRELFREFGDMRSAAVHYDRGGTSLGSAQVIFGRQTDAQKALKQYNGVHLDGRPMKIHVDGGNQMGGGGGGAGGASNGRRMGNNRPMVKRLNQGATGGSGGGGRGAPRGGRGRGRGARTGGKTEKPKSAEELDAELDSYLSDANKAK